ncbi:MAG TPA: hypothetical protein VGR91_08030 [Stellaceae bacterium]|nr:hypothetical protein [Stellaceae bacterium]
MSSNSPNLGAVARDAGCAEGQLEDIEAAEKQFREAVRNWALSLAKTRLGRLLWPRGAPERNDDFFLSLDDCLSDLFAELRREARAALDEAAPHLARAEDPGRPVW